MPIKTVLITGCSHGGLGAAMAKAYNAKGFRVFATLRNLAKKGSLCGIEGIEFLELEVTSQKSICQCAKAVDILTGGSLDILVNNAGNPTAMPLLDTSIDDAKRILDINVWTTLAMTQAFVPMLVKAKGIVCNVSSVSAKLFFAWTGIYNSSKAATTKLSEGLRIELAPLGVRVVAVMLRGVETTGNDPANKNDLELPVGSYY
ncbi:short chain dehydrogenase [Seiridium cupressi]